MQEELNQFDKSKVWTLVPPPKGYSVIGVRWIYKNKLDKSEKVIRNKAKLMAQGYNQQEGIDYDEIFAPVATSECYLPLQHTKVLFCNKWMLNLHF